MLCIGHPFQRLACRSSWTEGPRRGSMKPHPSPSGLAVVARPVSEGDRDIPPDDVVVVRDVQVGVADDLGDLRSQLTASKLVDTSLEPGAIAPAARPSFAELVVEPPGESVRLELVRGGGPQLY